MADDLFLTDDEVEAYSVPTTPAPIVPPSSLPASSMDAFSAAAPEMRSNVRNTFGGLPIVGPLATGATDLFLSDDEIATTPYEDPELIKTAAIIGKGPDNLNIKNLQAVRNPLRTVTELLFDNPKEKMSFIEKQLGGDWKVAQNPRDPSSIIVKKKGSSYWGVVDPGGMSFDELIQDAKEGATTIAQMVAAPAGLVAGALSAGGIQAVRQGLKKLVDPSSSVDFGQVGVDAVVGGAVGGFSGAVKDTAKYGAEKAAQGYKLGKDVVKARAADDTGIWGAIKSAPKMLDSPEWLAREYGASSKQFNDFQKQSIVDNIAYLKKASPEFVEANKALTIKGRYQALRDLTEKTGKELGEAFNDPTKTVNIKDIFNSDSFSKLMRGADNRVVQKGAKKVRVNEAVQGKIGKVRHDMLEQLGEMVLDDASSKEYLKAFRNKALHKHKDLKGLGAKNNDDAMMMLLQEESIPMSDAYLMKLGTDELVKYGIQKKSIDSVSSARKMVPDALREALETGLRNSGIENAEELIGKNALFHNLMPVVSTLSSKVAANSAETFNPLRTIPGTLYSAPRFAVALGRNLLNRPEVAAAIRSGTSRLPIPEGSTYMSVKNSANMMGKVIRGGQVGMLDATAEKQLLPRDAQAYDADPAAMNALFDAIGQDDVTDTLARQQERGDKEGFAQTLSLLASGNEDVFEPAPYKSLVTNEGIPVITDMYEREQYRAFLQKKIVDPVERYKALNALNMRDEMTIPPYEIPTVSRPRTSNKVSTTTTVGRVAQALKETETVEVGDGLERQGYDY